MIKENELESLLKLKEVGAKMDLRNEIVMMIMDKAKDKEDKSELIALAKEIIEIKI